MPNLPIQVLHQGIATRMSPAATVIRQASAWDDGVRYELTRTDGTTSTTDRTATALLLRLQVGGSTRLRGTHGLSNVDHQLRPQSCSIFPSGYHLERVTWEAHQSETLFFSVGELSHRDSVLSQPLASIVTPLFGFEDRTLNSLLQVLRNNLVGGEVDGPLFSEGISLAICSHLVHCHSKTSVLSLHKASLTQTRLRQVMEFVEENIGAPLTLSCLAEQAGLSRYHFVRSFKKATGITPFEYVTQARIKCASALLRKENLSLAEVALVTGFSSQSHMTTTFTRFTGLTPGSIRRSQPLC